MWSNLHHLMIRSSSSSKSNGLTVRDAAHTYHCKCECECECECDCETEWRSEACYIQMPPLEERHIIMLVALTHDKHKASASIHLASYITHIKGVSRSAMGKLGPERQRVSRCTIQCCWVASLMSWDIGFMAANSQDKSLIWTERQKSN
jgi:hypothetical protein